ncbi:MAG: D-tyrosyl-tRNA(Tyr) deacylase, partial [Proteobacteria bacterium]
MRILLQRVKNASVAVDGEVVGEIEAGLLLFVGFCRDDHGIDVERPASRVVDLRVFPDRDGRLQHSLAETGGGVLAVPQFTL